MNYETMNVEGGRHVKMWTRGVPVEDEAKTQLANIARMPFVHSHLAVMPDVHVGKGATVGSVIATQGAIIPAAVGVDIGCGMMAVQTSLKASDLPESLAALRASHRARRAARRVEDAWPRRPRLLGNGAGCGARAVERIERTVRRHHGEAPEAQAEGAAEAAGNAGWRQPLHRSLSRYRTDRMGDVALGFARHRQHDRPALHRAGAART